MTELEQLVAEQARDARYGRRAWPEFANTCSLDAGKDPMRDFLASDGTLAEPLNTRLNPLYRGPRTRGPDTREERLAKCRARSARWRMEMKEGL